LYYPGLNSAGFGQAQIHKANGYYFSKNQGLVSSSFPNSKTILRMAIKIGMVDDHNIFRPYVVALISQRESFSVVIEAYNGKDFVEKYNVLAPVERPSIVLVDVNMPHMDGFDTAGWLRDNVPEVKVIALSFSESEITIIRMIGLGVAAYLHKGLDAEELFNAIETVSKNGIYYNKYITNIKGEPSENTASAIWFSLSTLERQIVSHLCSELTYSEIAKILKLLPRAFENERKVIFEKFNVKTRLALAILVVRNKIIE
jgi:two-component system, NarL family, invasion response regulator UvrY